MVLQLLITDTSTSFKHLLVLSAILSDSANAYLTESYNIIKSFLH